MYFWIQFIYTIIQKKWDTTKRRLFNFLAALSLIVFIFSVVLWVRSWWADDLLSYDTSPYEPPQRSWIFRQFGGRIYFTVHDFSRPHELIWNHDATQLVENWGRTIAIGQPASDRIWSLGVGRDELGQFIFLGFDIYWKYESSTGNVYRRLAIPLYALAGISAVLPVWWGWGWWRSRRLASGYCAHCGYDLRGNQDASRCPECGVAAVAAQVRRER